MNTQNSTITKLAETALMAALCYVSFTFLQIKIPVPGGTATVDEDKIEQAIEKVFDLRPHAIIKQLDLRKPIYKNLAAFATLAVFLRQLRR